MRALDLEQRRHLIDLQQMYEAELEAARHALTYAGGMTWKQAKGREYLFRLSGRNGRGKSLGARSADTEAVYEQFHTGKRDAQARLEAVRHRVQRQALVAQAFGLGRVPPVAAGLLRLLDERGLLGRDVVILGTHCLHAYEAAAGVRFDSGVTATHDIDLLLDARRRLSVCASRLGSGGLMELLRRVDRSFTPMAGSRFRAVNRDAFMVDLIAPVQDVRDAPVQLAAGDLVAVEIPGLEWLLSAPRLRAVAVSEEGLPTPFVVPDPRAFAAHKAWLATRPDRDPLKKPRDEAQARAVLHCVQERLPHLDIDMKLLKFFPVEIARQVVAAAGRASDSK